jgi:DNA-directed RNA polymerase subunit RPC12/RpoP
MQKRLSTTIKCKNCKYDVTSGTEAEKIKCPRCGAGIFNTMKTNNSAYPNKTAPIYKNPNDRVNKNNSGTGLNKDRIG